MTNLWWARAVLVCVLAGCSGPKPLTSTADSGSAPANTSSPADYTFGFETREHQLWFHTGTDPQLYTVKSMDGEVLADGIDDAALLRDYPELHAMVHSGVGLEGIGY